MRLTTLKATNIDLTQAIRAHVENRVESLKKLCGEFDPADDIRVEVGKSTNHHAKGPYFRAEMNLSIPGTHLRAVEEDEDLYVAIDKVKEQIKRQLREYKGKRRDRAVRATRPGKE
jgi:ribosomal subunit interface protein